MLPPFTQLTLEPMNKLPAYLPGTRFGLRVTGDPGATVGLVAVDQGVYVLNNKYRLTQKAVKKKTKILVMYHKDKF